MTEKKNTYTNAIQLLILIWATLSTDFTWAIPSLDDAHKEEVNGYTLHRDFYVKNKWYYMPRDLRLSHTVVNGEEIPDFSLVKYSTVDTDNPEGEVDGGILQFSAITGLSPREKNELEQAVKQHTGDSTATITSPRFEKAIAYVTSEADGTFISSVTGSRSGIAPNYSNQKMWFQLDLTRMGTDNYSHMTEKGNGGVIVVAEYHFRGKPPKANFNVTVDWDKLYRFYSENTKSGSEAGFNLFGFGIGTSESKNYSKMHTTLVNNEIITISQNATLEIAPELLNAYMAPIYDQINSEVMSAATDSAENPNPANAKNPLKKSWLQQLASIRGGAKSGTNSSIVDVNHRNTGKKTFNFEASTEIEVPHPVSGNIGINNYPDSVKERLISVVPRFEWTRAYYQLPPVGDSDDIGISQVDMEVSLTDGSSVKERQVASWRPQSGWTDMRGRARNSLNFPLLALEASGFDLESAQFHSKTHVSYKRNVLVVEGYQSAVHGGTPATKPWAGIDVVSVVGSSLTWSKLEPDYSDLISVSVLLKQGDLKIHGKLNPVRINGIWSEPEPFFALVEKGGGPITLHIRGKMNSGRTIDWVHNGKNLEQVDGSLKVVLANGEWQ